MTRLPATRIAALAAAAVCVALCASCARAEKIEIPVPEGIDLAAAAEVRDTGNGLWLLDGPVAAGRVVEAMHAAGGGTMTASVLELVPVEQGDPLPGRAIEVTTSSDGSAFSAAISVGDRSGEIVVIGDAVWLRGDAAFLASAGVATAGEEPGGAADDEFVCLSRGAASLSQLETLADPAEFLRTALLGLEIGALEPAADSPGTQTLVLGSGGAPTGELVVESQGAPLPQRLFVADQSGTVQAEFAWGGVDGIRPPQGAGEGCG